MSKNNVPKEIQKELDLLPVGVWSLEDGGRHRKLRIDGKFVGVLPFGKVLESNGAGARNVLAQVRRARKQFELTR